MYIMKYILLFKYTVQYSNIQYTYTGNEAFVDSWRIHTTREIRE